MLVDYIYSDANQVPTLDKEHNMGNILSQPTACGIILPDDLEPFSTEKKK